MDLQQGRETYLAGNLIRNPMVLPGDLVFLEVIIHRFSYLKGHWERRPEVIWALVQGSEAQVAAERLREGFPVAMDGIVGPAALGPLLIVHQLHFFGLRSSDTGASIAPESSKEG